MVEKQTRPRWLGGLPAAGLENLRARAREETAAYLEKCTEGEVEALRADLESELAQIETPLSAPSAAAMDDTMQRQQIVLGSLQAFEKRS
jgi:hypothetical protein